MTGRHAGAGRGRRAPLRGASELAAVFAVAFATAWFFAVRTPVLVDTDSYYHLAVGRILRLEGWPEAFRWARFSLLGPPGGFPDKEPLFHLLLAPFAGAGPSTSGGRLALALLVAALAVAVAVPARRLLGRVGLVVPFALVPLALDVPDRLMRLRPELLSLLLLLVGAELAARGRDRAAGACAFLYTLSYTAFHLYLALVALWFLWSALAESRWRWALPLYAGLGAGLALLVHPAFPRNLEFWAVQNVRLFDYVASLGAGGDELRSATSAEILAKNLGWWLAAAVALAARGTPRPAAPGTGELPDPSPPGGPESCASSSRPRGGPEARVSSDQPEAQVPADRPRGGPEARVSSGHPEARVCSDELTLAAVVFAAMYLTMWRFALYFFPFATLAIAGAVARRPLRSRLPGTGPIRVPTLLAFGCCLLLALPRAAAMGRYFLDRSAPGPPREVEWAELGRALPDGARVAAPWGQAQAYLWFAPQGRYLNFLDPVLMAVPFPREFALQNELFAGREPDPALAAGAGLDSEWLAFSRFASPSTLLARAAGDPRLERVHDGYNLLYRIRRGANDGFLRDFRVAPTARLDAVAASPPGDLLPVVYPRAPAGPAAELEGFVDAARVGLAATCARFETELPAGGPAPFEFAPYGPGALGVDGRGIVELRGAGGAVLGQGATVELPGSPEVRRLAVVSCPDPATGRNGFYLRRR